MVLDLNLKIRVVSSRSQKNFRFLLGFKIKILPILVRDKTPQFRKSDLIYSRYLKRHNFCSECASNVNEAYSTLVGEFESDDDEVSCSSDEDNEDTPPALVPLRPALRSPTSSTESIDSLQSSSRSGH